MSILEKVNALLCIMVIYDKENDLSVVYENDEKLGFRLIYNGNADGYICLEPQTSLANSPNSPICREEAGFGWIEPGQTAEMLPGAILGKEICDESNLAWTGGLAL